MLAKYEREGGGGGVLACVAQITSRERGGGGGSPCVGLNTRPNDVYMLEYINYNLAVNLLCVSLNTFRREIFKLQA